MDLEANELRIGNFIYEGLQLVKVDFRKIIEVMQCNVNFWGIPITEEWLIKFGINDKFYFAGNLILCEDEESYYLADENDIGFGLRPIKYVHQLQNLYHSLTGKELEIKTK
jgi:hypothetical protein